MSYGDRWQEQYILLALSKSRGDDTPLEQSVCNANSKVR